MHFSPESAVLLQESLALVDQALGVCAAMETEHARKQAETERVYLEKVAAAKASVLDQELVDQTLRQLEDMSLVAAGSRAKLANTLITDPNQALHLLQRLVPLSLPAHQEGQAVDKSAGDRTSSSDPDGWGDVVRKGAA
jgi:hypothetical protein